MHGKIIDIIYENANKAALLSRFNMKSARTKITATKNIKETTDVSIDDCARLCIDKIGDECKTFGYCYLSSDCLYSTNSFSDYQENELSKDDHCDVYESKTSLTFSFLYNIDIKITKY